MKTAYQASVPHRRGVVTAQPKRKAADMLPPTLLRRNAPHLPEMSELDVVRHFTNLSKQNYSVDSNFYPLGSCTMKYNPKFTEQVAAREDFTALHPVVPFLPDGEKKVQGALEVLWETEQYLCGITGMKAFTLQPMAGAQGELTGVLLIAAYHKARGNKKTKIIIPDSAHGTNPASASLAGYEIINIPSKDGRLDPAALEDVLDDEVAGLMMTCPNTLGLFETHLAEIVKKLHSVDALLYYDGANFNAIMGKMRVGDVGFDVVHLNLHKTMGTPHGGGGPGSGPVGVSERLIPFLPGPVVTKSGDTFSLKTPEHSIGHVTPFQGHFAVLLKAIAYMMCLGGNGVTRASEYAVLNANYMRKKIDAKLEVPYNTLCMHEFVASAADYETKYGIRALDIAKALLEKGYHAPTIYFPLIVKECLMFEPTETESKETLDQFCDDLIEILDRAKTNPQSLHDAPVNLPVRRLDETKAAKDLIIKDDD